VAIPIGKPHLPPDQISNVPIDIQTSRAAIELADLETELLNEGDEVIDLENADINCKQLGKILIVDDNHDLRSYLRRVLNQAGYGVISAHNGAQGYTQAQTHHPDLIVTDLMMPQVSGLDLIAMIRQDPLQAGTPIILLTAKANEETRIEGTEIGADAYLAKPFNDRELLAEVRNLMALKANERRVAQLNLYLTESVLKRFLPPSLVAKAARGELSLDLRPEPKMITVLFTDIVGFTSLANTLRSRRVAELLNQYLGAMTEAIFANGGTVDKFMGDGIMALFGAPEECSPNEQVRRAVKTAKDMQRYLSQLNDQWQAQGIPKVRFRCGIHQGTAVVGMFGSAERSDYTAIGPTINIAARIQAAAEPDCILVSAAVADYLEDEELRKREPLKLKGVDETVLTFFVDNPL
jgi:adenylate cyclase